MTSFINMVIALIGFSAYISMIECWIWRVVFCNTYVVNIVNMDFMDSFVVYTRSSERNLLP